MDKSAPTQSPSPAATSAAVAARREKNARKRAAREAARKQAAARRRRQAGLGAFIAVVIVVGAVALIIHLTGNSPKSTASTALPGASSAPADTAAPSAAPSATPSGPPFPGVAAGMAAALKTKPVVKGAAGTLTKLGVTTLIQGKGATVAKGDTITVNYVGVTRSDGKEFDSSWSRSQTASFAIGVGQVIAGWDQGLVGVKVGSRVQLDIPVALAYAGQSGAPAGDLRFVVDVLSAAPAAG